MAELFSRMGDSKPIKAQIEISNLAMSRGGMPLFAGVSTKISNGDILWIQGDNGIGKTTLLGALAGLHLVDSGDILWTLDGHRCEAGNISAYQPHHSYAKPTLTAREDLNFWAGLYGTLALANTALEKVGLSTKADVPTGKLSAGQKRRLALAKLLISRKPIWIMDEPSAAMDQDGLKLIDTLVQDHVSRGGAAVIASHSAARVLSQATRKLTLRAAS